MDPVWRGSRTISSELLANFARLIDRTDLRKPSKFFRFSLVVIACAKTGLEEISLEVGISITI
jgi:hypothetical protein